MKNTALPKVSIVLACYCEEGTVEEVYRGLVAALEFQSRTFELIFVNDGSLDSTLNRLLTIWEHDPRVVLIDLVRNSGQWPALTAGICESVGEVIVFMDCDLQLEPADVPRLLDAYDEGYDLVGGRRIQRNDSPLRRVFSRFGNRLLRGISKGKLEDLGCALKAFNANFLHAFELGPMTPFRPLQIVAAIDRITEIPVSHRARTHGVSKWGSAVLIRNFGFAVLDLLQGRLRQAGMYALALGGGFSMLPLIGSGFMAYPRLPLASIVALLCFVLLGILLLVFDLLILSLAARRVRPAYIVRRVYRHPSHGVPTNE